MPQEHKPNTFFYRSSKYSIDELKKGYTVEMELTIRNITRSDLGIYFCNSTNSLGKADGSIRLYGKNVLADI